MATEMSKSLQAAVTKAGAGQPASAQLLAFEHGFKQPVSTAALIRELEVEQVIFETGHMSAGDVSGTAKLAVLSNGWFSLKINLHDSGDFFGDNFKVELRFGGGGHSVHWSGHLDADANLDKQADGMDPAVASNWKAIKSSGFTWHLHAEPAVGGDEWAHIVALALGAGGLVIAAIMGGSSCNWTQDARGNQIVRCSE